jgi:hypothetical protein
VVRRRSIVSVLVAGVLVSSAACGKDFVFADGGADASSDVVSTDDGSADVVSSDGSVDASIDVVSSDGSVDASSDVVSIPEAGGDGSISSVCVFGTSHFGDGCKFGP